MHKIYSLLIALTIPCSTFAMTSQPFRDNADVAVSLSNANYNRLVVKNDKIIKAHFPEGAMAIRGEEDGSLYVMVAKSEPFTVFLTTESGHHFSTTVSSENGLGKTIEFIPSQTVLHVQPSKPASDQPPFATVVANLMTNMMHQKTLSGFEVKHHYGQAIRLQQGLVLFPKLTYQGLLELYNGASKPVDLVESWFADKSVKAVTLSQTTLLPKQRAYVYRVLERSHG